MIDPIKLAIALRERAGMSAGPVEKSDQGDDAAADLMGFVARPAKVLASYLGYTPEGYLPPGFNQALDPNAEKRFMEDSALGVAGAVGPKVPGIRAFHGSPADFERFSMDKIGSGTGAGVYGKGLHFTDDAAKAETYRIGPNGKVYEVNIDADPNRLLNLTAPLTEQSPDVLKAFLRGPAGDRSAEMVRKFGDKLPGQSLYLELSNALRPKNEAWSPRHGGIGDMKASEYLRREGVPGAVVQGPKDNTYLTYSDDIIEILRKYGIAPPVPADKKE